MLPAAGDVLPLYLLVLEWSNRSSAQPLLGMSCSVTTLALPARHKDALRL